MIGQCAKCGNFHWDKTADGNSVRCPRCGHEWEMIRLPLFILTGCSGVGKTTAAQMIQQKKADFVVLDADIFYGYMELHTEEDYIKRLHLMHQLSMNIMQSGSPVLWTMAGNLDKLPMVYFRRFFPAVKCLALTCEAELLRKRMREGRGIADDNWIQTSVDYNEYFRTHDRIGDTEFENFDVTCKTPGEIADYVMAWVEGIWDDYRSGMNA